MHLTNVVLNRRSQTQKLIYRVLSICRTAQNPSLTLGARTADTARQCCLRGVRGSLPPGALQTFHVLTWVVGTWGCAYAKKNAAKHFRFMHLCTLLSIWHALIFKKIGGKRENVQEFEKFGLSRAVLLVWVLSYFPRRGVLQPHITTPYSQTSIPHTVGSCALPSLCWVCLALPYTPAQRSLLRSLPQCSRALLPLPALCTLHLQPWCLSLCVVMTSVTTPPYPNQEAHSGAPWASWGSQDIVSGWAGDMAQ